MTLAPGCNPFMLQLVIQMPERSGESRSRASVYLRTKREKRSKAGGGYHTEVKRRTGEQPFKLVPSPMLRLRPLTSCV